MKRPVMLLIAATMFTANPAPIWGGIIEAQAANNVCHSHSLTGPTASAAKKSKAKKRARKKWSKRAGSSNGSRWGSWNAATQKRYKCAFAARWYCDAIAVPCLSRSRQGNGGQQKKL